MGESIDPGLATIVASGIALIGAALGFIASQAVEYLRISREAKVRQKEKMMDRMIAAHESVISLADSMMSVSILEDVHDLPNNMDMPVRGATVVMSLDTFEEWWGSQFSSTYARHVWLSINTLREINFVQDYLTNIHSLIKTMGTEDVRRLSVIVRQDFIDMSGALRKHAMQFISEDAVNLKFKTSHKQWHKYKKEVTLKRLNTTKLTSEYADFFDESDSDSPAKDRDSR